MPDPKSKSNSSSTPHPPSAPLDLPSRKASTHSRSPSVSTRASTSTRRTLVPPSLRTPTARASNPHLSLVFAQSDPAAPQSSLYRSPSTLFGMRAGTSGSASEEALTRQLDRDSGGDRMGLRSRRSSSATVRSMADRDAQSLGSASASGSALPLPTPSPTVKEEDEEEPNPTAGPGPSTLAPASATPPATVRRLNPKTSSSWLRWSSPTPTFPKSPSRKGKEVDRGDGDVSSGTERVSRRDAEENGVSSEAAAPAAAAEPVIKTASEPPELAPPVETSAAPETTQTPGQLEPPQRPRAASKGWMDYIWSSGQTSLTTPTKPTPSEISELPKSDERPTVDLTPSNANGVDSVPPPANGEGNDALPATPIKPDLYNTMSTEEEGPKPPTTEAMKQPDDPASGQVTPGWGAYLASFVVNPKPSPQPVYPTSPVADQKPIPAPSDEAIESVPPPLTSNPSQPPATNPPASKPSVPAPAPDVVVQSASPAPAATPAPRTSNESSPTRPPRTQSQALSQSQGLTPSSSSGWLNYLALRSAKKVNAGSIRSDEARKSTETVREEVMDFEGDPDFPPAPGTDSKDGKSADVEVQSKDGRESKDGKDGKDVKVQIVAPTQGKAQSLSVRKKRLSNASKDSLTPLSTSPKNPSIDSQQNILPKSQSALPPPPQAALRQPNLVIPSFTTTFDRPPRSFLPPPPDTGGRGVAAATTGLAWKAIGAVGSYVYGEGAKVSGTLAEDPKEVRGRKEGRGVGNDLPRRIGLGMGTPEDGWRLVRRVVVVGVHGWFPAKLLNPVIGEPTGTSQKFANMMGDAVRTFFRDKGIDESDLRLTLIPLEGEGTIDHRVDKLYKAYLSNPAWINDLRRADAIFFAAHSQGCIVTTHLMSRLIAQGHIRTPLNREAAARCEWAFGPVGLLPPEEPRRGRRAPDPRAPVFASSTTSIPGSEGGWQKVAMLAMCGIHQGPLYSISTSSVIQPYLQWFENAAARELFEFQDTTSAVSEAYQRALSMVLENGARVLLLSSLNDQVVPIYGASFSSAHHPLLLRALFVDGAAFSASDFMTNLLCFAFMLRNAGIDDQRLVEHLSEATAGSLTGVGHSTPYEEPKCYALAVEYLFLAGQANIQPGQSQVLAGEPLPPLKVEAFVARDARNDYELPWIMRALVDSPQVKDLFPGELRDLREGVVSWRPQTKVLKEIKKRLEPMAGRQSKLRALPNSPSSLSLASVGDQGDAPTGQSQSQNPAQGGQGQGQGQGQGLGVGQKGKLDKLGNGVNGDGGPHASPGPRRSRL